MYKKILTIEQLAKFCAENKLYKFNAEQTGYQLCVQVPSTFEKQEDKSDEQMCYVKIKLLHTNSNRNKSSVTYDAAKNCMPTIKYKPILANFTNINGELDFTSHDFYIDDDGNTVYEEHQVGCFTVDEPYLEYEEEKDRYYLYAYGAIPKEYTPAYEIINRKSGTKVSAELAVNAMSFDSKNKELLLEDIEVMGVTLLGTNGETGEEVQEGMEGARLDIEDFSVQNNSVKYEQNDKLIETLEKLNNTLSRFDIDNSTRKEEDSVDLENKEIETMEESIKKNIKDDDSVAVATDEEDTDSTKDNTTPIEDTPTDVDDKPEEDVEPQSEPDEDDVDNDTSEDNDEVFSTDDEQENEEEIVEEDKKSYSIEINGVKREFSVSLADKQMAIETLVNDTYCESDNDYYFVDVYEDDKTVVMHGMFSGKHFRQSYKVKKDVYSLVGDRVSVYAQYLTQDEISKLDSMKANYSDISEKLSKYEAEPEKIEILESPDYSSISDKAEFIELKEQKNHFDLSIDELKAKADEIILLYAKKGALNFASVEEKKQVGMKRLSIPAKKSTKRSRYGGLGKKED